MVEEREGPQSREGLTKLEREQLANADGLRGGLPDQEDLVGITPIPSTGASHTTNPGGVQSIQCKISSVRSMR